MQILTSPAHDRQRTTKEAWISPQNVDSELLLLNRYRTDVSSGSMKSLA